MLGWIFGGMVLGEILGKLVEIGVWVAFAPAMLAHDKRLSVNILGILLGFPMAFFFVAFLLALPMGLMGYRDPVISAVTQATFLTLASVPVLIVVVRRMLLNRETQQPADVAPAGEQLPSSARRPPAAGEGFNLTRYEQLSPRPAQPLYAVHQVQAYMRRFCTQCGQQQEAQHRYCARCGSSVAA